MSGKHLQAYFQDIVEPNRKAFFDAPTEVNLWNYAVSLHHVVDYDVAETAKDPLDRDAHTKAAGVMREGRDDLKCLGRVADAFKHRKKLERLVATKVVVATTSAGAVFMPLRPGAKEPLPALQVVANARDGTLIWRTTVDGRSVDLNDLLETVFEYWKKRIKP